ncbi:MAG: ribosome assembly factor SBDS [Candidatus Hodarchaeales archaeon]|jgi:ribosome maturation protein SDO1
MFSSGSRDPKRLDLTGKSIARLRRKGKRFEVLIDPDQAFKYRTGQIKLEDLDMHEFLEIDAIFTDVTKGIKAGQEELDFFGENLSVYDIAAVIVEKGEVQLTQAQRQELTDKKRRWIVNFIAKNSLDPKTKYPHPPTRIENAISKAKARIDPFEPAELQAKRVIKDIRTILPIILQQVKLALKISPEYTGVSYGIIKRYAVIEKEQWSNTGHWIGVVILAAGQQPEFLEKLERVTKGHLEVKTLERTRI